MAVAAFVSVLRGPITQVPTLFLTLDTKVYGRFGQQIVLHALHFIDLFYSLICYSNSSGSWYAI